jgi:proline utilization trans-activator
VTKLRFSAVYGTKGRLRKKFVLSMKAVLQNLTSLVEELRQSFPLHADERFGGISRMPAHLHLLYYQVSAEGIQVPPTHG